MHKLITAVLFLLLFFSSCEKDLGESPSLNPINPSGDSRLLLVGNEGSFGTNTASLSVINLSTDAVTNNVYRASNSQDVGDVLQSITRINDLYYMVVNNSNKILVTDTNFKKIAIISGLTSPRYITAVSETRAYVSSLFNDKIYIIDLIAHAKISEIQMDYNWTEEMLLVRDATGNNLYVCENDTAVNYITKLDVVTNQIVDRIPIAGYSPSKIVEASNGNLWILSGNNFYNKVSTLTELNPITNQIVSSFSFPSNYTTQQLAIGPSNEKYVTVVDYTTNAYGVFKFSASATSFPASFFIHQTSTENFYGISVDPLNGDLYVSDSKGFTQAGAVNKYSSSGVLSKSWTAAIGPSSFYFVD